MIKERLLKCLGTHKGLNKSKNKIINTPVWSALCDFESFSPVTCVSTRTQPLTATLIMPLRWNLLPVLRYLFSCTLQEQIKAGSGLPECSWTHFLKTGSFEALSSSQSFNSQSGLLNGWGDLDPLRLDAIVINVWVYLWHVPPCGPCHENIPGLFSSTHITLVGSCWLGNTVSVCLGQAWVHWPCPVNSLMTGPPEPGARLPVLCLRWNLEIKKARRVLLLEKGTATTGRHRQTRETEGLTASSLTAKSNPFPCCQS